MLKIKQFVFNMFGVNTYLITDKDTGDTAVIDPGMIDAAEKREFDDYVSANNLKITQIINTHLHLDHCFGDNYVRDKYGVKVAANINDQPLGDDIPAQMARFGGRIKADPVKIDVALKDGDIIKIGDSELRVITTPGHSPGGISLYSAEGGFLISGDTLFRFGVGRTDLPGGDHNTLIKSIREKLMTLPDATKVLPGHDRFSTIADERRHNPYI